MAYETNIEAILNIYSGEGRRQSSNLLQVLEVYLNNGAEDLTLEQYKDVRTLVDSKYKSTINHGLKSAEITNDSIDRVGHLFTDYLRDQHARLLDIHKGRQEIPNTEKKIGLKQKFRGYWNRLKTWKNQDDNIYNLERALWTGENLQNEHKLVDSISSKGLSKYKLRTLERMLPRTRYKRTLGNIINNGKREQIAFQYRQIVQNLKPAI